MAKNIGWRTIEEKQKEYESLYTLVEALKERQKTLKSQRNPETFDAMLEQEIFNNKKQLKEFLKRVHTLEIGIKAQAKRQEERKNNPIVNTDTAVYKMFGKPLKELTREELNLYQSRKERKKRKQEAEQLIAN